MISTLANVGRSLRRVAIPALALMAALVGTMRADAQQLDDSCNVTVNGQTVQVNADGTFVVPNVAAADLFGPGGPGTPPDFLSDDFLRLTGVCNGGATPVYVLSECFRIRRGESLQVGQLSFTGVPPLAIASITASPGTPTLTTIGQQTPINVTGFFTNGTSGPLDPQVQCPATFRTSNPAIVSVTPDPANPLRGRATARAPGTAIMTVSVEGATSSTSITVSLGDPLTTVTGIVQTTAGDPVNGAVVKFVVNGAVISGSGTTGGPGLAPGQFLVAGIASQLGPISAYAEATINSVLRSGVSLSKTPVPAGFTDAGLITLDNRIFWITNADGPWFTATNWVSGVLPTTSQIAVIDVPANITVTLQQCPSCSTQIGGIECSETFAFVNGGLTLSGPTVFHGAYVAGTGTGSGAFLNGAGAVTFNGPVTLSNGTLGNNTPSAPITLNAGMTITSQFTSQLFGRTLTNANNGTIAITGTGSFSRGIAAVLNNPSGSLFDIRTDADSPESLSPSGTVINNAGTFRKSGGTGLSTVGGTFNNTGVVEVQTGTLQLPGGTGSGTFTVSPGAALEFATTLQIPQNVSGSVTVPASGALRFTGFLSSTNFTGPTQITGQIFTNNGTGNFNAAASAGVAASSMNVSGGGGAGTLIFAGNVSTGSVSLGTNGVLAGAGTLTVNGPFDWSAGNIGDSTAAGTTRLNGGMTLSTTGGKTLTNRTLINANNSLAQWTGGFLSFGQGSVFENQLGATFDIRTDSTIGASDTLSRFDNAGTLRKTTGTGLSSLVGITLTNTGLVEVQTGTLQVGGGTSSGGFTAAPGATLDFSPPSNSPRTITGDLTIPLGGTLRFGGNFGITNVNGPTAISGAIVASGGSTANFNAAASAGVAASSITASGATISFAGGASTAAVTQNISGFAGGVIGGAGTLTVNGPYDWSDGTMGIGASGGGTTILNGGMTISGTGVKALVGRTLTNANNGTMVWNAGFLTMSAGSVINNPSSSTFDVRTDGSIGNGSGVNVLNNAGTLRKTAGTGLSSLPGITLNNTGLVEAQTGTLQVGGGTSSGDFTAAPGATLDFSPPSNSPQTITGDLTIPLGGTLRFGGNFGITNVNGPTAISGAIVASGGSTANFNAAASTGVAASTITVSSGTLSFAGGAAASGVTHGPGGILGGPGTLTVNGPYSWADGTMGIGAAGGGTTILNGGMTLSGTGVRQLVGRTLTNSNNGTMAWSGGFLSMGAGSVINNPSGSTFDVQTDGDINNGSGVNVLNNAGTFRKSAGTASPTVVSVNVQNTGLIEVTSGTLDFNTSGAFTQSAGSTVLAGGSISRTGIGSAMQINGGTIGLGPNTSNGTITGNVTLGNAAATTVPRPGAAGTLSINGAYTQSAGTLDVELGGLAPGTEYDRLAVVGNATVGGVLNLTLINGFVPNIGDTFQVLTATGTLSGAFTTINRTNFPPGLGVSVTHAAGAVTVQIISN